MIVRIVSGLIGGALLVLFVRFDVAVMIFRALGFGVERFWNCPIASTSLAEFWGVRWNRIVSGWLREVIFQPLARRAGATVAMLAVFFYSGLFHETFSFIAEGGYGLPMLYFLIQGAGVWVEGRRGFRRLLLRRPWLGRTWTFAVVVGPAALMINPWVVESIVMPLLREWKVPGVP
jgi:alginate O-acetyltransferase complex protein AlgI